MSLTTLQLRIEEWLERNHGDAAERASFGTLMISIGDRVATRVLDYHSRSERDVIRVSMIVLARWLATNYYRLKFEPFPHEGPGDVSFRLRHEMGAAGEGFLWPALAFGGDGESVVAVHRSVPMRSSIE